MPTHPYFTEICATRYQTKSLPISTKTHQQALGQHHMFLLSTLAVTLQCHRHYRLMTDYLVSQEGRTTLRLGQDLDRLTRGMGATGRSPTPDNSPAASQSAFGCCC